MITRNFFLYLSNNKFVKSKATKWGPKFGARSIIAGETIDEAINTVRNLNEQGMSGTVDHLGEFVTSREEALESANFCIRTLEAIAESKVDCHLSLKLTQLGLDVDRNLCRDNMMRILETADKHKIFVRIDMEDYAHLDATLEILHELRESFEGVGTAIQGYLYRAEKDTRDLKGVNLRLIKGAYKESPDVAYQNQEEVNRNYLNIIKAHLLSGSYTAVATHDHRIIDDVKAFVIEHGISNDKFEFQMLYGFRRELQVKIAKEGYKMRIYIPFGNDWFAFYMRRLAERPQNISFALRGLI
ncbi:proline dehydrogenase family protein [Salipaludibacillus sp. HK11]|uniref:proline dehydrogenase family protein n=1 Tax=Salipaludibacillus sp. HK11 TaxID=3394320 RepID=UPI0039FBA82C